MLDKNITELEDGSERWPFSLRLWRVNRCTHLSEGLFISDVTLPSNPQVDLWGNRVDRSSAAEPWRLVQINQNSLITRDDQTGESMGQFCPFQKEILKSETLHEWQHLTQFQTSCQGLQVASRNPKQEWRSRESYNWEFKSHSKLKSFTEFWQVFKDLKCTVKSFEEPWRNSKGSHQVLKNPDQHWKSS